GLTGCSVTRFVAHVMGESSGRLYIVYFFFQAEDGIRDWSVTGVQTCALPISGTNSRRTPRRFAPSSYEKKLTPVALPPGRLRLRSEERRVGKEGRSRWTT